MVAYLFAVLLVTSTGQVIEAKGSEPFQTWAECLAERSKVYQHYATDRRHDVGPCIGINLVHLPVCVGYKDD